MYRDERLGLLAIHILLAAFTEHYSIKWINTKICCDNEGELYAASTRNKRLKAGAPQADIDRVARRISNLIPKDIIY